MKIITFELSAEMDQYADDIHMFVDLMIHKLQKNVHKGRWENVNVQEAYWKLQDECSELLASIRECDSNEIYLECADVANFAMIIASIMKERGNE